MHIQTLISVPTGSLPIQITPPTSHKNEWNKKTKWRSRGVPQQYPKQDLKTWFNLGEVRRES